MKRMIKGIVLLLWISSLSIGCDSYKNEYLGDLELSHTVYVNDDKLDTSILSFYYGYSLMKYINGYYTAFDSDGFDMTGFTLESNINALQDQTCTIEGYENQSWEYYFIAQASEVYREMEGTYQKASSDGYIITAEDTQGAQDVYTSMETYCTNNDIAIKDYLRSMFGTVMTKEMFIEYYEKIEVCQRYVETLKVEPTDLQIEEYYELYKDDIDEVSIRYFAFGKDNLEEAKAFVNAVKVEEDFQQLALTYSQEENKEIYQNTDITLRSYLRKEDLPEYLQETVFSKMDIGTTTLVEGTNSYDVVMLVAREKPMYQQAQVATIYLDARETDSDTLTEEKMQASKLFAEQLVTNFEAEENPTLDTFHTYNQTYSDDKNNQGDYDTISRGDSTKEIEKWLFDDTREVGDIAVLPSTYGYSIVYFRGYGDIDYYQRTKELTREKLYEEAMENIKNSIVINIK